MLKPLQIFICSLLACVCFTACKDKKNENNIVVVQPDIVNNPIYKKLNKGKEPADIILYGNKKMKPKTSDVFYQNSNYPGLKDTVKAKDYTCDAYIKDGYLTINIGMGSMFGGFGFHIKCTNEKYSIEPYEWSDAEPIGKHNPVFKVIKQSLILNKNKYFMDDSIFGKVDFKIIEDQKITHIGNGYFRGKIEKSN